MAKKAKMRRKIPRPRFGEADGSVTVETAYLLPVLLSVFFLTLYAVFYYHDKVIMNGAAGETAAAGASCARLHRGTGADLERFYEERIEGKLILLRLTDLSVEFKADEVTVSARASSGHMRAFVKCRAKIARPEKKIRAKRLLTGP